jgi:acetylornithine deacetylase/succinyl-diaminopimelate desuccinylase-like protein
VDITVRGVGGHGAYPHAAKDPVVLAAEIVLALGDIVSREIAQENPRSTVGSIHGGSKHNIIPDKFTCNSRSGPTPTKSASKPSPPSNASRAGWQSLPVAGRPYADRRI